MRKSSRRHLAGADLPVNLLPDRSVLADFRQIQTFKSHVGRVHFLAVAANAIMIDQSLRQSLLLRSSKRRHNERDCHKRSPVTISWRIHFQLY